MKKKNNGEWENLFPLTLFENIYNNEGTSLPNYFSNLNDTIDSMDETFTNNLESVRTELTNSTNSLNDTINSLDESFTNDLGTVETTLRNNIKNKITPVETPNGFNWQDHPLQDKIFTDGKGNYSLKGFNINDYEPVGTVYYVDPVNGDNANDGRTPETAFRTLVHAEGREDEYISVKLRGGVYFLEEGMNGYTINKNISIKPYGNEKVILTSGSEFNNLQVHDGVVYSAYSTTPPSKMIDINNLDNSGNPLVMERVSSIEALHSRPNSWYHEDDTIYFRTFDSREPTTRDVIRLGHTPVLTCASNNHTVYTENIHMYGGTPTVMVERRSPEYNMSFIAKNCHFKFSLNEDSGNAVHVHRTELVILEDCSVYDTDKDGFWYTGEQTHAIEINCSAENIGKYGSNAHQGSTAHDGAKVIRINGNYRTSSGPNIADTHENTQGWIMGSVASNSNANESNRNANYMAYSLAELWIEGSIGYDSRYDITGTGTIHVRNNNLLSSDKYHQDTNPVEY